MKKIYSLALFAFMGAAVANAQAFKLDKNYVLKTCVQVEDGQKVDGTHKGDEVSYSLLENLTTAFLDENFTTFPISYQETVGGNYHVMAKDYTDAETGFTLKAGTYATIKCNEINFYDSYNPQGLSNIKKVIVYLASQGRCKCGARQLDALGRRINFEDESTTNREIRQYYAPNFSTETWTEMYFDQPLKYVIDLTNAEGTEEEKTGSGMKMTSGDMVDIVTMLYQFYTREPDPTDETNGEGIPGKLIPWTEDNNFTIQLKQAAYIMGVAFVCGDENAATTTFDITSDKEWSGTETGISNVVANGAAKSNVMYNLAGQRIAAPVSGQIYILNGKKYIAE
ncbi:MAG: hypothetical protein J1E57_03515 [Prevotella sp.]|nr:hypothetical protein [Prevotella sp.]